MFVTTVTATVMKLSGLIGTDVGIMLLNSPGGSTVQWGMEQGCCALHHFLYSCVFRAD